MVVHAASPLLGAKEAPIKFRSILNNMKTVGNIGVAGFIGSHVTKKFNDGLDSLMMSISELR